MQEDLGRPGSRQEKPRLILINPLLIRTWRLLILGHAPCRLAKLCHGRFYKERLENLKRHRSRKRLADELDEIACHCASLPVLDKRSNDEIIGYDENGMPT
jgi:hypothetical protein